MMPSGMPERGSMLRGSRLFGLLAFFTVVFSGCGKPVQNQPGAAAWVVSFRDIPGVTRDEISAIEALKKKYGSFVFGTNPSTGAFTGKDGGIEGYTLLFCGWLTDHHA
jgi:hypothetical protein